MRRRAERGLERGLREEDAALLRGMVLGQDERLSDAVRDEFQVSGLAHLLAVSGQNVMLLAILVLAAAGVVGLPLRARLALALLLVAAYVPLAGGGPSIQRAGVMGAAGLVAALAGRPASRWYALGLAAAATLALNPLARARSPAGSSRSRRSSRCWRWRRRCASCSRGGCPARSRTPPRSRSPPPPARRR